MPETPTRFWLAGCPRVLKNNKRIECRGKGKPHIRPSKACEEYLSVLKPQIAQKAISFQTAIKRRAWPLHIVFTFVMDTTTEFDYGNMQEAILDAITGSAYKKHEDWLSKWAWIPDDSTTYIVPYHSKVLVNKNQPGTWLTLLPTAPVYDCDISFW